MLSQTIDLTKTWENVRLHVVRPELPKVRKRMLKHLEKSCILVSLGKGNLY